MITVGGVTYQVIYDEQELKRKAANREVELDDRKDAYIQTTRLDKEFVDYLSKVLPKISYATDYYSELSCESSQYLKDLRLSQGRYGFDDIVESSAKAYATLYQEIVEGHRDGTRELYIWENGEARRMTLEEDLEKLEKGYERIIDWDKMLARSRMSCRIFKQNEEGVELDNILKTASVEKACKYIEETYLKIRSEYQEQYSEKGNNASIESIVSSALNGAKGNMHEYCQVLFGNMVNWAS